MKDRQRIEPRRYRESVMKVVRALVMTIIVLAGLVYWVDPFQHYRKASFYTPMFDHQRYLNPGVARNFEYDTVIIGTSMAANFVLSNIRNATGMDAVNLSIHGATLGEQGLVLDVALRSGRLENVLYCLDIALFNAGEEMYRLENLPLHLYDESPLNDYKYLFDAMSIKMLYYIFAGNTWDYMQNKFDPDRAFNWGVPGEFNKASAMRHFNLALKWQAAAARQSRPGSRENSRVLKWMCERVEGKTGARDEAIQRLKRNFDQFPLRRIKENPGVDFILFYPPYSYLHWQLPESCAIEGIIEFKRYIFDSTSNCV